MMGDEANVVARKLMSAEEVFVYKIPPLTSSGGHRAEDWNLATPLKTCSLLVEERGTQLFVLFEQTNENDNQRKSVFALSKIDMSSSASSTGGKTLEYYIEQTVDSSRYFAVRIIDEKSGRDAWIGFGFRNREEATDFRESLQQYVKSVKRDSEQSKVDLNKYEEIGHQLKLKEGEKIHVQLHGKSTITEKSDGKKSSSGGGGAVPLLKKPPPPGSVSPQEGAASAPPSRAQKESIVMKDVSISFGEFNLEDHSIGSQESDSTGAVGGLSTDGDDAWRDFEGV